jgi:predicted acyltransferase (DUF342 family)
MKAAVKRIIRMVRDETGHAMELVLILLTVGGLVLSPLLGLMSTGLLAGQVYERKTQEYYAADAGVEDCIAWLLDGKTGNDAWEWYCGNNTGTRLSPIYINGRYVDVAMEGLSESNTYKITSIVTGPQGRTTIMCTLFAVGWMKGDLNIDYTFYGNAYVDGNVTLENPGGQIVGDLVATGNLNLENQTDLSSNVSVDGNVVLENNSDLTGNLCAAGNVSLGQSATVTGDISVEGDLVLDNNSKIYGNVFITGGNIKLSQNCDIVGNIYADGDMTITFRNPNANVVGSVCDRGSITVSFHNKQDNQITGSVNATGTVTVNHPEAIKGGYCSGCNCTWPDRPPCPGIPVDPLDIYTWEIV